MEKFILEKVPDSDDEDTSDEEYCDESNALCDDGTCLLTEYICDGHTDCPDNSDEAWCGGLSIYKKFLKIYKKFIFFLFYKIPITIPMLRHYLAIKINANCRIVGARPMGRIYQEIFRHQLYPK